MMQLQGKLPQPIENLTLNKYFELVKEIELAFAMRMVFQNVLDMKTDWLISKHGGGRSCTKDNGWKANVLF